MRSVVAALVLCLVAPGAFAQSPYRGMQTRSIKALSEQQIADLKAGRGMGLALPAELNGYPGPVHVLELADQLGLSAEQRTKVQALFDSMKTEAVPLGEKLLAKETALDYLFTSHLITAESLKTTTAEIGVTQAALRDTHLKYHLMTAHILSAEQMHQYAMLRGYGADGAVQHHHEMQ